MKKLAMFILMVASSALADIAVTPGAGKTVATITNNSREIQQVSCSVDGTSNTVTTTQSGTWTMQPGNTANTTPWLMAVSTIQVHNGIDGLQTLGYQAGASSMPVNVLNIPAVSQSGTWTVQPGNTQNTSPWITVVAGTPTVTQSGTWTVQPGNTPNTTAWFVTGGTMTVYGPANGPVSVAGTKADNGVAAATDRVATLPAIYQTSYLNGTAATQGRNGALSQGTDGLLWTAQLPSIRPASYHASSTTAVAASATDIAVFSGNGTNTVLVTGVRVSCTQTTAGNVYMSIIKRSTNDILGTFSTMTVVADDSNYAAASSTAVYMYSANPTRGAIVGVMDGVKLGCMAAATATPNDIYISPANWRMKPIVLRGANQQLAVSLVSAVDGVGTTVTGGSFNVTFEWIETATITP